MSRTRIPRWAVPVLAALPVWAYIYAGTMTVGKTGPTDPVVAAGQKIFLQQCSGCHGADGSGGVGRQLNNGQVILTFPNKADHLAWVKNGSPAANIPYGNPNRPGGQHVSGTGGFGKMPAFGDTLSAEQINEVVTYERQVLGGEQPTATGGNAPTNQATASGGSVGGAKGDTDQSPETDLRGSNTNRAQQAGSRQGNGS